jgi:hypothetical protein
MCVNLNTAYPVKKEKKSFLIFKEILKVGKGLLIYEALRKYLVMNEEDVSHICMTLHLIPSEFPYMRKIFF